MAALDPISSTTSRSRSARPATAASRARSSSRTAASHAQALPGARRRAGADGRRRRLLPPLPRGVHQAARDAAALQHAGQLGLPVRLRPVPRPRAALVPDAGRDHRRLQPALPDLLRRQRRRTGRQFRSLATRSSACSTPSCATRASRTSCRSPAASRRSIRDFFDILDLAKARPIKHLMVNTNGIRIAARRGLRRAAGRLHAGLRGLPAVRLVRARRADASCAAPTCAASASRRSSG